MAYVHNEFTSQLNHRPKFNSNFHFVVWGKGCVFWIYTIFTLLGSMRIFGAHILRTSISTLGNTKIYGERSKYWSINAIKFDRIRWSYAFQMGIDGFRWTRVFSLKQGYPTTPATPPHLCVHISVHVHSYVCTRSCWQLFPSVQTSYQTIPWKARRSHGSHKINCSWQYV